MATTVLKIQIAQGLAEEHCGIASMDAGDRHGIH